MGNVATKGGEATSAAEGLSVVGKRGRRRRDAPRKQQPLDDGRTKQLKDREAAISTVRGLLGALNLAVYSEAFVVAGCCDAESLAQLTPAGLARIERKSRVPILPHHQALLLHASQQLRQALAAGDTAAAADQDAPVRLQPWPSLGSPEDEADTAAAEAPAADAATASGTSVAAGAEGPAAAQQQHLPAAADAAAAPAGEQPPVVEHGSPAEELHAAGAAGTTAAGADAAVQGAAVQGAAPAACGKPAGAARTRLYKTAAGAFGRLASSSRKQQQQQRQQQRQPQRAAPAAAAAAPGNDRKPLWRIAGRSKSSAARADAADRTPLVASPLTSGMQAVRSSRARRAATVAAPASCGRYQAAIPLDQAAGSEQQQQQEKADACAAAAAAGAAAGPAKADVVAGGAAAVPTMPPIAPPPQPLPGLSEIEPADSGALDDGACPWQQQAPDRSQAGSPASVVDADAEAALGPPALQREECFCEGSESVYWSPAPGNPFLDEEVGCFGGGCFAGAGDDAAAAAGGGMMPELSFADGGLAAAAAGACSANDDGSTAVQGAGMPAAGAKHTAMPAAAAAGPLMAHKPAPKSAALAVSGAAVLPSAAAACALWNGLPGAVKRQAWGSTASLRTQPLPALAVAAAAVARPARKKPLSAAAAAAAAPGVLTSQAFHLQQLMREASELCAASDGAVVAASSSGYHHQHQQQRWRHPGLDASQCNDSTAGALQQLARQQASNQAFIHRLLQQGPLAAAGGSGGAAAWAGLPAAQARTDASQQQQQVVLMGPLVPLSRVLVGMNQPTQSGQQQQQQQQLFYRHAASEAGSLVGPSAAGAGMAEVRSCLGMGTTSADVSLIAMRARSRAAARQQQQHATSASASCSAHPAGALQGRPELLLPGQPQLARALVQPVGAAAAAAGSHTSGSASGADAFAAAVRGGGRALSRMHEFEELAAVDRMVKARMLQLLHASSVPGGGAGGATEAAAGAHEEPAALAGSSMQGHQPQAAGEVTPASGAGGLPAPAPAPAAADGGQATGAPAAEAAVAQMRDSPMKQRVPCSDQQQKLQGSGPQQQQQVHASPSRQAKRRATRQLWEGSQPVDAAATANTLTAVQPVQTAGGPSYADQLQQHITAALGQAGAAAAAAAVKALSTAAASDQQHRCSGAAAAGGSRAMAVVAGPDVLAKAVRANEGAANNPLVVPR